MHRIIKRGDKYIVQRKCWFFWWTFRHHEYWPGDGTSWEITYFSSLEEAQEAIRKSRIKQVPIPDKVVWEGER